MKRKPIEELFPVLESEDAFTRLEAEQRLRDLAQRDFGFRWDAAPEDRTAALARIRLWLDEFRKRERARRSEASGAAAALELAALQGLSLQEAEKHLQALLGKGNYIAGFTVGRPRCEGCAQKAATVEIVDVKGRSAASVLRLCDSCAAQRGEGGGA